MPEIEPGWSSVQGNRSPHCSMAPALLVGFSPGAGLECPGAPEDSGSAAILSSSPILHKEGVNKGPQRWFPQNLPGQPVPGTVTALRKNSLGVLQLPGRRWG